jgi:hypothetical protein
MPVCPEQELDVHPSWRAVPQANSGTIARFLTRFLNGRSLSNYCRTCFADFKKKAARVNGRPEAPLGEDQKA